MGKFEVLDSLLQTSVENARRIIDEITSVQIEEIRFADSIR